MRKSFSSVKMVTSDVLSRMGVDVKLESAGYEKNKQYCELKFDGQRSLYFEDPTADWSVEEYGLILDYRVVIRNTTEMFECGIADLHDKVRIGCRLKSAASHLQFVHEIDSIGEIESYTGSIDDRITLRIPAKSIRSSATLELFLFLKASHDSARMPGMLLGTISSQMLCFSMEGSEFPVHVVSSQDPFLWKLEVDYEDPFTDPFSESVKLVFNERNGRYSELKIDGGYMASSAFNEILAQAIMILVLKCKEDEESFQIIFNAEDSDFDDGTVAKVISHFIHTMVFSTDDPLSMSRNIHKYLETEGGRES